MAVRLLDDLINILERAQKRVETLPPPREKVSFRVKYFPAFGRGAALRATAAVAGVSFEDEFYSFEEQKQEKGEGKRRFSGLPEITLYDEDGKDAGSLGQSNAILRYLGIYFT